MTVWVLTDQIWLGWVTFLGVPQLCIWGVTRSQVVTGGHKGLGGLYWPKFGGDELPFWASHNSLQFGITWSQVVTCGHKGHMGSYWPNLVIRYLFWPPTDLCRFVNTWSQVVTFGHRWSQWSFGFGITWQQVVGHMWSHMVTIMPRSWEFLTFWQKKINLKKNATCRPAYRR